jgi:hypothetical protein
MTVPYIHGMDLFFVISFEGTEQELFEDDVLKFSVYLKLALEEKDGRDGSLFLRAAHLSVC